VVVDRRTERCAVLERSDMTTTPDQPVRDEDIETVGARPAAGTLADPQDADGTDADGTDSGDGDTSDGDATDTSDGDSTDADGTDA
jgi:hypothetical protein